MEESCAMYSREAGATRNSCKPRAVGTGWVTRQPLEVRVPGRARAPVKEVQATQVVAQWVKHPTLSFSSDHELRVMRLSNGVGSPLSGEPAGDSLPLPPPSLK